MSEESNNPPPIFHPEIIRGHDHEFADNIQVPFSFQIRKLYLASFFITEFCNTFGRENIRDPKEIYELYSTMLRERNEVPLRFIDFRNLLQPISSIRHIYNV